MAGVAASQQETPETENGVWWSAVRNWWQRMVADQALQKCCSMIRVRQHELAWLIEDGQRRQAQSDEQHRRLERATHLVKQEPPEDRAAASELLDELDGVLPLVADEDRLRLMLEAELEEKKPVLTHAAQKRARELLESTKRSAEHRRQLESLVSAAIRERNDRLREERFTGELRQNYLTWLGSVLLLLLGGVVAFSIVAAHVGLWAQIVLALLSGALGGTLSGVIRLRVPESRLTALKNLGPVMLVQPLVGAVGGIILYAIWRSGLLSIAGLGKDEWSSVAVVAFVGGFSERFFLRSRERITGASNQARSEQPSDRASQPSE
jgi:hypothetical protein